MSDPDLDELAAALSAAPEARIGRLPREERIIAGFEEVQRFVEQHGRAPHHGEDRDIFERLYSVRLDQLRALPECRTLLAPLDHQGLLGATETDARPSPTADVDELAADKIGDEAARCNDCGAAVFPPTTPITVSADGHVAVADGKGAPGIPMQIICPGCHDLHIDKGEFATKPHHTHACQNQDCGLVWRPALVNTIGVRCLPGFLDEEDGK